MSELLILALIGFLVLSLLATILGYLLYSGLAAEVCVRTGSPPVRSITVAYKFKQGAYKDCGALFTESCSIAPQLSTVGVFYDDPKRVPGDKCRYAVGSILSEGEDEPSEELVQLYQKFGFRLFSFPGVTHAVTASFPHRTPLSIFLGAQRVYPQLSSYVKERKLCAHPFLEVYQGDLIHYMSPLARQGDFYVPEVMEAQKKPQDGEESEEDRRTDVTGSDSHSDSSSVSHDVMADSRETSPAPSSVPSLPQQELADADNLGDRSSGDSVASGSSFEELDMEVAEGQEDGGTLRATAFSGKPEELEIQQRESVAEGEE